MTPTLPSNSEILVSRTTWPSLVITDIFSDSRRQHLAKISHRAQCNPRSRIKHLPEYLCTDSGNPFITRLCKYHFPNFFYRLMMSKKTVYVTRSKIGTMCDYFRGKGVNSGRKPFIRLHTGQLSEQQWLLLLPTT